MRHHRESDNLINVCVPAVINQTVARIVQMNWFLLAINNGLDKSQSLSPTDLGECNKDHKNETSAKLALHQLLKEKDASLY